MATYDIVSPDGRKFRINAPDDATQDDVLAYAKANIPAPVAPKPEVSGPLQAAAVAMGHVMDRGAAGLRAAVPDGVRNAIDKAGEFLGMGAPPPIDAQGQANQEALYAKVADAYPKSTFMGDLAGRSVVANPVGAGIMAATEIGAPGERLTRGLMTFGASKAGEWVGGKVADKLASRAENVAANLAMQKAQNAARDATIAEAQKAGYVIPPTQVNPQGPGAINRVLEGVSGKIQTAQAAAIKNQQVTNQLAKQALSLPEDAPLTRDSIGVVRSAAGQVYKAIKGFGPVQADDEFRAAIGNVANDYKSLINEFPSQSNGSVNALLSDLSRDNFNSSTMVEFVKRLRHDGFKNIISPDPEKVALGRIQVGAQNALEDLLDRRVAAAGDPNALQVFRNARTLIAKSYTVEKALDDASGKVVASKIGKEFTKGRPLTGELATIGKMAETFPRAVQDVKSSMPGLSPLDAMFGTGAAIGSGNPLAAALPLARPAIRAGILSAPYQKAMASAPTYAPGLAERLLAKAGQSPEEMKLLGGLLGLGGLQAAR